MTRIPQTTREPLRAMRLPVIAPARTPAAPALAGAARLAANPLAVTAHRGAASPPLPGTPPNPQAATTPQAARPAGNGSAAARVMQPAAPASSAPPAPPASASPPLTPRAPNALQSPPVNTAASRPAAQPATGQTSATPLASTALAATPAPVTSAALKLPMPPVNSGAAINQQPAAIQPPPGTESTEPAKVPGRLPAAQLVVAASRDAYAPSTRAQTETIPSQRLLDSLAQITRAPGNSRGTLVNDASRLLTSLNTPEQMTRFDGLKKAVLNSGLFLEARLAGKSGEPTLDFTRDFKAALLRLRADLGVQLPSSTDPKLTDVASQVERTLARLDLSQLATVAADREQKPAWALEIPVRTPNDDVEVARLNIHRDANQADEAGDEKPAYSAVLQLEPAGLGKVTAHISVIGESVSVGFQMSDPRVQERFSARLDALRTSLGRRGLQATRLTADKAQPASSEAGHAPFMNTQA